MPHGGEEFADVVEIAAIVEVFLLLAVESITVADVEASCVG